MAAQYNLPVSGQLPTGAVQTMTRSALVKAARLLCKSAGIKVVGNYDRLTRTQATMLAAHAGRILRGEQLPYDVLHRAKALVIHYGAEPWSGGRSYEVQHRGLPRRGAVPRLLGDAV